MARQPGQHFGMFMGGIVVENDMDRLASCDMALDSIEKADEFEVAVALHAAADHGAVQRWPSNHAMSELLTVDRVRVSIDGTVNSALLRRQRGI